MKVRDVLLQAAANLLSGATGWCQGTYARGKVNTTMGEEMLSDVDPRSTSAECRCAVGACAQVAGFGGFEMRQVLGHLGSELIHFNDREAKSVQEVVYRMIQMANWPEANKEIQ